MLLTSLHGHTIGDISVLVLRYTNNSARHLSLEFILASEIGRVWSTEAHRDSESLYTSTGNICSHLTGRLADGKGKNVLDHN